MRSSGILLPVASIPSDYGIGGFSRQAYEFVDALKAAGQKYWQILPLGPTGYGDSPYQSFSTFAGNPYFIDLQTLVSEGLLTRKFCESFDHGGEDGYIDYEKIYKTRFKILKEAFRNSRTCKTKEFKAFVQENRWWLPDYSLYMAVKNEFGGVSWNTWDEDIRLRKPDAIDLYSRKLEEEILFYEFLQFKFDEQWRKLKAYANSQGIEIIGDIPIYVSFDSADAWANPELFQFTDENQPVAVAGCPPDGFSATGQLWGNPLYRWDYHKQTGYAWWTQRMSYCLNLYDVVRVDHFRGFDEYYAIPYGEETAEFGHWEPGPGINIFKTLTKKLGKMKIIAEDLGFLTKSVRKLLKDTGYPGMKVLEFAFDSREESDYLPHNYTKNCVVYTGTHDNETIRGWYEHLNRNDKRFSKEYLNNYRRSLKEIHWDFIRLALASVADLAIIPVQDYLGLGNEARINHPSTLGGNWIWRMKEGQFDEALVDKIRHLTKVYGRLAK